MSKLTVVGHEGPKQVLRTLGAHTLLFSGPAGVGRRQVARWHAARLNCAQGGPEPCERCESCTLFLAERHPDYREIGPNTLTKTGKSSRRPEIRIAQLVPRPGEEDVDPPLSRWLEARPQFKRRVAVIDNADTLNVSAANAFLKTLEEPPAHATIILIAPSPGSVLSTVASRSAPVRFGTVALPQDSHPAARLGRLGDLRRKEADPAAFEAADRVLQDYVNALPKGLEEAFEAADALEKLWLSVTPFDLTDLLLARFSTWSPARYAAAQAALARFEDALSAYAAAGLAAQVLTLELRETLKTSI